VIAGHTLYWLLKCNWAQVIHWRIGKNKRSMTVIGTRYFKLVIKMFIFIVFLRESFSAGHPTTQPPNQQSTHPIN